MSSTWQVFRYFSKGSSKSTAWIRYAFNDQLTGNLGNGQRPCGPIPSSTTTGLDNAGTLLYDFNYVGIGIPCVSAVTSTPNYAYFMVRKGGYVFNGSPDPDFLRVVRVNLSNLSVDEIQVLPTWEPNPTEGYGNLDIYSTVCIYTEDIVYIAIFEFVGNNQYYHDLIIKCDFSDGSSNIIYTGDDTYGTMCGQLAINLIPSLGEYRLTYPEYIYDLDTNDPSVGYYVTAIEWKIFDPSDGSLVTTVTQNYGWDNAFMNDGNNVASNSTLVGNDLVTFFGDYHNSVWDRNNIAEIHRLNMTTHTLTVTRITRTNGEDMCFDGGCCTYDDKAVALLNWYDTDLRDYHCEVLYYDPSSNALTSDMLSDSYYWESYYGVMTDGTNIYALISHDSGSTQDLVSLPSGDVVFNLSIETYGCAIVDSNKNGVLLNNNDNYVDEFFNDATYKGFSFAYSGYKYASLHGDRLFVIISYDDGYRFFQVRPV